MRCKDYAVLALIVVLLLGLSAVAQEITGSILGTVKDQSGAVVPNATVTITNTDKNIVVRTIKTDDKGDYVVPLLPIGHYSLAIDAAGFKKFVERQIELNVNDKLTINPTLQIGAAQEQVVVEANPVQVELQTPASAGLISGEQIRGLTLNNRNYIQLVTLMPGVSSTQSDQFYVGLSNPLSGGFNTLGVSVNGQRTSSNNWTVDGADNVDRGSNLGLLTTPSVDSIAEFKVLRSNYNAEFGRSGASQVTVMTRSGTQSFHGTAYEFWRNENLNADSYLNKQNNRFLTPTADCRARFASNPGDCDTRAPLRYHNFGWTVGGPVYIPGKYNTARDKTFFFFSQEYRRVITYGTASSSAPTAAELAGNFSNTICVGFDAVTGACSQQGTTITTFSPTASAYIRDIFSKVPLGTSPATHSLFTSFRNKANFRQEVVKVDHVFSPRLSVYGRYIHDDIPTEEPLGLFGPNTSYPGVGDTKSNAPGWSLVGRATATLRPTMLLEAGYNYSYGAITSTVTGLMNPANSPDVHVNMPFQSTLQRLPTIGFSGFLSAIGSFGPYEDYNRNHQVFANLSKMQGKHNLKFGGTYYHYQKTENAASANAGSFAFNNAGLSAIYPACYPTVTAGCTLTSAQRASLNAQQSWANFLLGRASSFTQASLDLFPDVRDNQIEMYGQDEWRIHPRVTVSYGVRYSMFRQPTDANAFLTNFDPKSWNAANAPQLTSSGLLVAGTGNLLNGMVPSSAALEKCPQLQSQGIVPLCWASGTAAPYGSKVGKELNTAFAPRLGIAWDPFGDGKTSIRTGYGMFYDVNLFGIVEQNIFSNQPFVQSVTVSPTSLDNPGGIVSVSSVPRTVHSRVDPNYKTPYTQQWSLDVQRELGRGFLADIGYYGNKGTHLIGILDLNQPQVGQYITAGIGTAQSGIVNSGSPNPTTQLNRIRPYPGFGPIPAIRSIFNSNYNALQASLTKRFAGTSQINVAYTWSKALTDNQTDRSTAPQNTYDIAAEYGPMQQDRTHIFSTNYIYELPFFKGQQGAVGKVLGGWELSGIFIAQTGVPLTVTYASASVDRAGQGCLSAASPCGVRPDMNGNPNSGAAHDFLKWFDSSVFVDVPVGQVRPGNEPRGTVRGPGMWRVDMTASKNIKFTERFSGQLRADAFNVFNHTNPDAINTSIGNARYNSVTTTKDPRIMQLGLKLMF